MGRLFTSLIQSNFGGEHKNFEAVVLEGRDLWHWWRDNATAGLPWKRGQRIVTNRAAFPGSIIQSNFGSGDHGNFEVVVPLFGDHDAVELWHVWHDNSDVNTPWRSGQRITEPGRRVIGPASIIQSNFGSGGQGGPSRGHGNFEVVVPVVNNQGQAELRHYWHDNADVNLPWRSGQRINDPSHTVLGAGCLIQSNFGNSAHGNFEVCAFVRLPDGRTVLQHYWHDNSDVNTPWQNGQVMAAGIVGPGVIIQGSFGSPHANFEVVAPIAGPGRRTYLQHIWHDNSDVHLPWRLGQVITEVASSGGSGCLIESDYRSGAQGGQGGPAPRTGREAKWPSEGPSRGHGNFELLVDECQQSLSGYWHPNEDVTLPWLRNALLLGEPPARAIRTTTRLCQLTGEYDRTGWNGSGTPPFAFNKTETRYGIRGTDLGVSFEHKNRLYFLFGDTWRNGETRDSHFDWDSIAFCTDTTVSGGLSLTFYKQPPIVHGISQGGFEVPLDGFSFRDLMFAFFSTDHRHVGDADLMGRSVLGVSENDGYDFGPLLSFSRSKFINVSVERARLTASQAQSLGWAENTEVLWVWGSGRYRSSPAYLAVADLSALIDGVNGSTANKPVDLSQVAGHDRFVRFFAGGTGGDGAQSQVVWSPVEQDAVPLFCAADIGELSCRRNAAFGRYFMTYNSGNPRGIILRHAPNPWGPWSAAIVIFDPGWERDATHPAGIGYGTFMHIPWNVAQVDHVQDDMFLSGRRDNDWAGEYGPYQITRFSTGSTGAANESCDLFYTMSTWNPYESMLMRTHITTTDLG